MGYAFAAPLDEALWPIVHSTLVGDSALALVTYGPRAVALQWSDLPQSPHAEDVDVSHAAGVLRVVFHNGTREQREGVLGRLRDRLRRAGADVELLES
jgi:hypothetical protein